MQRDSAMAQVKYEQNSYVDELKGEMTAVDPSSHAARLLQAEVTRLEQGGGKEKDKNSPWIHVHPNSPQTVAVRVYIPVKEFPKYNFVGKLLGPKGNSLKRLQDETGTKMSILGRGSMRDRAKEEEMRKEGGKYAHLNEDLHVLVEVYTEITDAYQRIAHAVCELKKFMTPEDYNDEIRQAQLQELMFMNGDKPLRGRGGFRGAPRGGRGGAPPPPPPVAPIPPPRGALAARGTARGAPSGRAAASRGAPGGRGASRGRGTAPPPVQGSFDEYGSSSYDDYPEAGYGDQPYGEGYGSGDPQYYDYGSSSAPAYDDYGDGGWGAPSSGGPVKASSSRGGAKGQYRSHPYGGSRGGY